MRGIGQEAKLPGARPEVRLTRAYGSGKARRRRCRQERGVELTVREQQRRWMKHENGEGEMERYDTHTANTLSHACSCLYVTQGKCAKIMCVRHGVCVLSPSHTPWLPLRGSEILSLKKKVIRFRHSTSILISPTRTWIHQFAFHRCHFVEFNSKIWFTAKNHFQLCESHMSQSSFSESRSSRYLCRFLILESDLLPCMIIWTTFYFGSYRK